MPSNIQEIVDRSKRKKSYETNTRKNKDPPIKTIGKENPYDFPLSKFKLHDGLKDCGSVFKKPYRSAIREALLNLEEHIREKISSEKDGRALISDAKNKGVFKRNKNSESDGLFFLYSGAIMWLRNPPNHRKLKYGKEEALKIILFTDYLIQLFNQLCMENKIKKKTS